MNSLHRSFRYVTLASLASINKARKIAKFVGFPVPGSTHSVRKAEGTCNLAKSWIICDGYFYYSWKEGLT